MCQKSSSIINECKHHFIQPRTLKEIQFRFCINKTRHVLLLQKKGSHCAPVNVFGFVLQTSNNNGFSDNFNYLAFTLVLGGFYDNRTQQYVGIIQLFSK